MSPFLNATTKMVSTGPAGYFPSVSVWAPKSGDAAHRAIATSRQGVKVLAAHPEIGRPIEEMPPEFREWVIEFGQGAYVALYHFDGKQVVILAVRHGREAGY